MFSYKTKSGIERLPLSLGSQSVLRLRYVFFPMPDKFRNSFINIRKYRLIYPQRECLHWVENPWVDVHFNWTDSSTLPGEGEVKPPEQITKLYFYRLFNLAEILTPKYVKPESDHLKGKLGKALLSPKSLRGKASDLL